ncbi:MAG TPA: phosphoribosylaminoimidazolesuccinocarboxamide synthase, partial [Longimicrobiales bacterium]|nr:phosphoribosylaminoimidazolesuccinocarboxamide synthase [Longimicrobiales bacterium]
MNTDRTTSSGTATVRTDLPFPVVRRGKVRDVYDVGGGRLLLVASDRISAFDVVMPQGVPGKGAVLTLLSAWWLTRLAELSPHHMLSVDPDEIAREVPALAGHRAEWERR